VKLIRILIQTALIITVFFALLPNNSIACKIFILKEEKGTVTLQAVELEKNKTTKFFGKDYITFVLPVSPGKSGSVVQLTHRKDETSVICNGETISVTIIHPDGSTRDYPQVKLEDLDTYQIRVNIVGGNGVKKVYQIQNYQSAQIDKGPVFDMLGSIIPLQSGEYSITTETEILESQIHLSGKIPLKYEHPLLFIEGTIDGGKSGTFIVDFGAGGTVVGKKYLPDNVKIEKVTSVMYSEKGTEVSSGIMGGVGGEVSGFLGNAQLRKLYFGEIEYADISVRVLEKLPDFNQKKIAGIIGLDLLQQGDVVSVEYKTTSSNPAYLHFGLMNHPDSKFYRIPFSIAYGHIFVEGGVNDIPVSFLFDTGARSIFISESIAGKAKLELSKEPINIHGLDENKTKAYNSHAQKLKLGDNQFNDISLIVSDLPVLKSMGLLDNGGLLGNSFLEKFQTVQIDFKKNEIRLWDIN
jgi:hypothetical protein